MQKQKYETFTLARPGDAPLRFTGALLAQQSGRYRHGRENNRWHDIRIYRTKGDALVLQVEYRTVWQGEEGALLVGIYATPQALVSGLHAYDPTESVSGFPPGDAYHEKQRRLLADIERRYKALVGEMLADYPTLFAEILE